jgi:hypothetical protein
MRLHQIYDWATVADYDHAKQQASDRIVRRQSRGNVSVQNGWYMTPDKLRKMSKRADESIASLRKAFSR